MLTRRILVSLVVVAMSSPATASELTPVFECRAEVTPRTASSGATGQSFTLKISNGANLPVHLPVEEINLVAVTPPIDLVLPTGASAPSPWSANITGTPPRILFEQGEVLAGGDVFFSVAADIANLPDADEWFVRASRDEGQTTEKCEPAFPGALDITVT